MILQSVLKLSQWGMMDSKPGDPEMLLCVFTVQHYKDRQRDLSVSYRQTLLIFLL